MASIRQSLSSKGISERAINLISNDRRIGSQSNYKSPWRRWISWCYRKQTGLFSNRLREVLDFLAEIFELRFEYSTINTHRSVISTFHEPGEGFSVGKHPKFCNLITSVYNKRPSNPRYCFVWDIETVLRYLRSLSINKLLSTKMLTLKLAMLFALPSASRCSEMRHSDIWFYTKSERKFCLYMIKPTKLSKANKPLSMLEFSR